MNRIGGMRWSIPEVTGPSLNGRGAARPSATRDGSAARALHVAVVHGRGAVHYITAATSLEELTAGLARYVELQAAVQLHQEDAARVCALLAAGAHDAAVDEYFLRVGARWDEEWLHVDTVDMR